MKIPRPKLLSKRQADELAKELLNGLEDTELSAKGYVAVSGIDFAGVRQKARVLMEKHGRGDIDSRRFYLAHTLRQFVRKTQLQEVLV